MLAACTPTPPCSEVQGGDIDVAAGYTNDYGEVTLEYQGPTSLRAVLVATGRLAAIIQVWPPPGVELAIAQSEGPTFLSAADDDESAYARLTDARGTLFEGGSFWALVPAMDPPALIDMEEDGRSTCRSSATGYLLRSMVVHMHLDEPVDLHIGEHAFGELDEGAAFAMVNSASAHDTHYEPGVEDGPGEGTGYFARAAMFRLAEDPAQ
ncbi:MAG: hypothetical protein IT341_04420 [Chloroflexi bacterium]|nr:hypothetical protein [Chloroflexota bacterium]